MTRPVRGFVRHETGEGPLARNADGATCPKLIRGMTATP